MTEHDPGPEPTETKVVCPDCGAVEYMMFGDPLRSALMHISIPCRSCQASYQREMDANFPDWPDVL